MKRWFSTALALIMLCSQTTILPTRAEGAEEVVSAQVEEVPEPAQDTGAEGLAIQIDGWEDEIVPAPAPENDESAPELTEAAGSRYGVLAAGAMLREAPEGEPSARTESDGVALILEDRGETVRVAFNTESGVLTGWVYAGDIAPMDAEAANAFMDAVAASGAAALYRDDADAPLDTITVRTADESGEEELLMQAAEAPAMAAGFALETEKTEMLVGDTFTISAVDHDGNAIEGEKLTFSSSDESVATVDESGVVTACQSGSAAIAVSYNGRMLMSAITVPEEPESIELIGDTDEIGVKETCPLMGVAMLPEGSAASVTWSTSNEDCVAVDAETGELRGIKTGSATITARTRNGKKASRKVTVRKAPGSLTLSPESAKLSKGMRLKLEAGVPEGTASATILYESSDARVATVDGDGLVTTVGVGRATITARTYNGRTAKADISVSPAPASVAFDEMEVVMGVAERRALVATAEAADGSDTAADITYAVSPYSPDPECIAIDAHTGETVALGKGTAVVVASAGGSAAGVCRVRVLSAPVDIRLSEGEETIGLKETYDGLTVELVPPADDTECAGSVTWSSSNGKVLSVDEQTGVITGLKTGSATVTVRAYNGLKAACKVTVKKAPSKLDLGVDTLNLSAGGMTARLNPETNKNTASGGVEYTSSDTRVVTVDGDGLVTSVNPGTATITAVTYNGKVDTCRVTVYAAPAKVSLDSAQISVGVGEGAEITATAAARDGSETLTELTYYIEEDSPDPGCIRIDAATGEITGVRKGRAYVNAVTHNGVCAWFPCTVIVRAAPAAIRLPETLQLGIGQTHKGLKPELIAPEGESACAAEVTWSSGSPKVVSIDAATGAMKALKKGNAVITARTAGGLKATCKVSVTKAPADITMEPESLRLSAGGMQFKLNPSMTDGVTFTSSNAGVATVSEDGTVTTVNRGTATITAETYNGRTATCALTVTDKPAKASFGTTSLVLIANETAVPVVNVRAADGSEAVADLSFRVVFGADYIDLDERTGEVTALKQGVSVVSVTTHNGVQSSNTCTITVVPAPTGIELTKTSAALGLGETFALGASVTGERGCDTSVRWQSSNESVAAVDAVGNVTAVSTGTATITAATANGLTADCKVTVKKAPTGISISPKTGSLSIGATGQYKVSYSNDAAGSCTFESSNPRVASVDDEGVVTGLSAGTVTITATSYNGCTAEATLTIKDPGAPDVPAELEKLGIASYTNVYNARMSDAEKIEYVIYNAQNQLGKPYVYGAGYGTENPSGFDCSGLVNWCYRKIGIKLGDSAYRQGYDSNYTKIVDIADLRRGDVVCFNTSDDDDLSDHTGIYLGQGYFIHASSGKSKMKVVVQRMYDDPISNDYYRRNFSWGRRIL